MSMEKKGTVFIVDDDEGVREGLSLLLEAVGQPCELYSSAIEFLEAYDPSKRGCLVLDIRMPRMSGLDLQQELNKRESWLPIIFITGHGDIPMAVDAMRRGALDFVRKPFREQDLLDRINEALEADSDKGKVSLDRQDLVDRISSLTERESEVFHRVVAGDRSKVIGIDLGISERTVEAHRAKIMKKLGVRTLSQLVRIELDAERLVGSK